MKNLYDNKNILIVGLGLLGMSLAMAFRRAGLYAAGFNRHREAVDFGIREKILAPESEKSLANLLKNADVVFLALPIPATVKFVKEHADDFKKGAVVTDLNSTKGAFMNCATEYLAVRGIDFVGSHPMAGTEKSGHLAMEYEKMISDLESADKLWLPGTNGAAAMIADGIKKSA